MKQIYLFLASAIISIGASAQLPKWVISPNYNSLEVIVDDYLLQTDSLGNSTLWTMDGKRLFSTEDEILPFKDGVAVVRKKDKNELVGVVDTYGKSTKFPSLQIAYEHPYFENGYLICHEKDGYVYYQQDGTKASFPQSVKSYPFHKGFATYLTFDRWDKRKEPYYGFYRADGEKMKYRILEKGIEKEVDYKLIEFLSNIGANGNAIAVIKNKLYLFNPETEVFEPFLWGEDDSEKKRHLTLNADYEKYFLNLPNDTVEIVAKFGKNQLAVLQFDNELRPVKFEFDGDTQTFQENKPQEFKYSSELKSFGENGKFGLATMSSQVLPIQFDEIALMYGNKAFVKHNGLWGVIEIIPALNYSLKINKGEDVAFRHQKFETQIRLDLPAIISAKDARIDIPSNSGCVIDKTSRETKDTESGNYVVYDCTLNIPDSLPDTMTEIVYSPVSVSYDGITLFETPINIKAWHLKYYNVDPIESETSISNGVASFTININAQKNVGESDYPFEVKIEADSSYVQYEKISETRYKCMVSNLQEGNNNLNIFVTEKGCPPSVFPFEVYYTKPVPKKKKQEEVVVRKKSPVATKPSHIEL